jgi:hypothetical protein
MPVDPLLPPSHRRGPRPLMLHLALSLTKQNASGFAWPNSNADWQNLMVQLQQSAMAANQPGSPFGGAKQILLPDPALIHAIVVTPTAAP